MPRNVSFDGKEYPLFDHALPDEEKLLNQVAPENGERPLDSRVAEAFIEAYRSDSGWGWGELIVWYLHCDEGSVERALVDKVFVHLTGWSLATLIDRSHAPVKKAS